MWGGGSRWTWYIIFKKIESPYESVIPVTCYMELKGKWEKERERESGGGALAREREYESFILNIFNCFIFFLLYPTPLLNTEE